MIATIANQTARQTRLQSPCASFSCKLPPSFLRALFMSFSVAFEFIFDSTTLSLILCIVSPYWSTNSFRFLYILWTWPSERVTRAILESRIFTKSAVPSIWNSWSSWIKTCYYYCWSLDSSKSSMCSPFDSSYAPPDLPRF